MYHYRIYRDGKAYKNMNPEGEPDWWPLEDTQFGTYQNAYDWVDYLHREITRIAVHRTGEYEGVLEEDESTPKFFYFPEYTTAGRRDTTMEDNIIGTCAAIEELLLEKNRAYGNSALDPVRIFSKADPVEQLRVRIDDKLSRIARGHDYADEDTILDLIGYLVLLKIAREGT